MPLIAYNILTPLIHITCICIEQDWANIEHRRMILKNLNFKISIFMRNRKNALFLGNIGIWPVVAGLSSIRPNPYIYTPALRW